MPNRWTYIEEDDMRRELRELYAKQNLTIGQIALRIGISESGVYNRLVRLQIPTSPSKKLTSCNRQQNVRIPSYYSGALAECIGVLLGDGHLSPTQVTVTLGIKERYADYVALLLENVFRVTPKIGLSRGKYYVVYFGSSEVVRWLSKMGLVRNKVRSQVDFPAWILEKEIYQKRALRGFFDTDGSVYRMGSGIQFSFNNRSLPLLHSARAMLVSLGYHASCVSGFHIYLTRRGDLSRYVEEIGFGNPKHKTRWMSMH